MFSIHPQHIKQESENMKRYAFRMRGLIQTVKLVQNTIPECLKTNETEEIVKTLYKLHEKLDEEEQKLMRAAEILMQSAECYLNCEDKIIAEAQEIEVRHYNVSASYHDLTWFSEKLSGVKFK